MSHRDHRGRRGFTRTELVVLVVVIAIAGLLIIPPVMRNELASAHNYSVINNGKQIYTLLFCAEAEGLTGIYWPVGKTSQGTRGFRSSSEFFTTLVSSNVLDVSYNFFVGPKSKITAARNRDEFLGGKLRNMWCITLDVSDRMNSGTPTLFTQNFKFSSRDPDATLDQFVGLEPNARPYGDRAGVVLQRGGAAIKLDAGTAIMTNFNPTGATNGFLWPLASGQDVSGR